jgi:hypothetical protein
MGINEIDNGKDGRKEGRKEGIKYEKETNQKVSKVAWRQ